MVSSVGVINRGYPTVLLFVFFPLFFYLKRREGCWVELLMLSMTSIHECGGGKYNYWHVWESSQVTLIIIHFLTGRTMQPQQMTWNTSPPSSSSEFQSLVFKEDVSALRIAPLRIGKLCQRHLSQYQRWIILICRLNVGWCKSCCHEYLVSVRQGEKVKCDCSVSISHPAVWVCELCTIQADAPCHTFIGMRRAPTFCRHHLCQKGYWAEWPDIPGAHTRWCLQTSILVLTTWLQLQRDSLRSWSVWQQRTYIHQCVLQFL